MKKVVLISPAHPLRGGIAASTERLALQLQEEGAEVRIISFTLQYPAFLFPGKTQYTDDPAPPDLHIEARINAINPFNWISTGRYLASLNADMVVVRFWLPFMAPALGTLLRIARRRQRHIRIIGLVDNLVPHEHRPGDTLLSRWFTGSVDAFIAMSHTVRDQLRQFEPQKRVAYVPHPLYDHYGTPVSQEEAIHHLGLPPAAGYLLFFGFIRAYKGLDILLRALAEPSVRALNLHLIIAGEFYGNEQEHLNLIAELGINDSITLHAQYIPSGNVRYYFSAADLVVQPYRSATQSGISQLAYHFEKPMVVTNVGGLPEIVDHGHSGYVVPAEEQSIAGAIVDFFTEHRSTPFIAAVREAKARFSWSAMSKALWDLYQQNNDKS